MPSIFRIQKMIFSAIATLALVRCCAAAYLALISLTMVASIGAAVGSMATVHGTVTNAIKHRGVDEEQHYTRHVGSREARGIQRRQEENQLAWELCHSQLTSATVTFSAPSPGNVLAAGMPPACMTLATVITGQFDEGSPVPQGTDSILFQNLTNEEIREIQDAIDTHPSKL
ncbi:hypothetical protein GGR54DRAFT_645171 [Hypoxylon sp. NC1633]|nr:hypothetical protein GGR54DRAFT_645171 [Hypoxylon sp. NC1633]